MAIIYHSLVEEIAGGCIGLGMLPLGVTRQLLLFEATARLVQLCGGVRGRQRGHLGVGGHGLSGAFRWTASAERAAPVSEGNKLIIKIIHRIHWNKQLSLKLVCIHIAYLVAYNIVVTELQANHIKERTFKSNLRQFLPWKTFYS